MSTARTITDQILDLLAESEEGLTVGNLRSRIGRGHLTTLVALSHLLTAGKVQAEGDGLAARWKIRPAEPEYKPLTVGPSDAQFVEGPSWETLDADVEATQGSASPVPGLHDREGTVITSELDVEPDWDSHVRIPSVRPGRTVEITIVGPDRDEVARLTRACERLADSVPRPAEAKSNLSPTDPSSIRSHFGSAVTDIGFTAANGRVAMVVCHESGSTTLWLPQDQDRFTLDLVAAQNEAVRQARKIAKAEGGTK